MFIKATLALNFGLFSHLQNLRQYKHAFGSLFHMERNEYCSTFPINIESSLIIH